MRRLKQAGVKPEWMALDGEQNLAVVSMRRVDQQIQLGWLDIRRHPQPQAGYGFKPGQAKGLRGRLIALPVGRQPHITCRHERAVIRDVQLHQGLIFRVGPIAVDTLFQLAQGPIGCCINYAVRPFGMPAAVAQGRAITQCSLRSLQAPTLERPAKRAPTMTRVGAGDGSPWSGASSIAQRAASAALRLEVLAERIDVLMVQLHHDTAAITTPSAKAHTVQTPGTPGCRPRPEHGFAQGVL